MRLNCVMFSSNEAFEELVLREISVALGTRSFLLRPVVPVPLVFCHEPIVFESISGE